jgi:uncharacterized protein YjeT (DUF2065 family)
MELQFISGSVVTILLGLWGLTCLFFPRYVPKALNAEKFTHRQLRLLGLVLLIITAIASLIIVVPYVQLLMAGELF